MWTHVAKNPCRGPDTCKLKQPRWESERACVWAWNPTKLQHYLQTADQKVMFLTQIKCCSATLPSLQALSPLIDQILSRFLSCRAGSWPVIWWNSASKAQFWTGRNLRRRKQLHWLLRLRRRTKAETSQCELNQHQLTTCYMLSYDIRWWWYHMKKSPISANSLCAQHFLPHALVMSSADESGQQCRSLSIKFPNIHPPDSFDTAVNHDTHLIHDW